MSYTAVIPIQLGASKTGLTLTGQLYNSNNSVNGASFTSGIYERGNGLYVAVVTVPDAFAGWAEFTATGGIRAAAPLTPQETENADAKVSSRLSTAGYTAPDNATIATIAAAVAASLDAAISSRLAAASYTAPDNAGIDALEAALAARLDVAVSTRLAAASYTAPTDPLESAVPGAYASGSAGAALGRIASAQVTTVNPVATTLALEIVQGADYPASLSRALSWADASAAWPDLTGATITFRAEGGGDTFTAAGSVVAGTPQSVRVELTAAQTGSLTPGENIYAYQVWVTVGEDTFPLVQGRMTVKKKLAA